jgi:release factor glutamine methyltransferase
MTVSVLLRSHRYLTGSLGAAAAEATHRLAEAGIDTARLDARVLSAYVLGVDPSAVFSHPETSLSDEQLRCLDALIARREAREPVAHLIGEREFWSLALKVTRDTLVPRPETETLVEVVLDRIPERNRPLRILDLGTGSGCVLLALLSELSEATGIGIDASEAALAVASDNARRLGLDGRAEFSFGHWGDGLNRDHAGAFHFIVSNPPYIATGTIGGLMPEVARFDPRIALDGGADGLESCREMVPGIPSLLAADGVLAVEIGDGQDRAVSDLFSNNGLQVIEVKEDLSGIGRCVVAAIQL